MSESLEPPEPCRFGYVEYDGFQFCHEHRGWRQFYAERATRCDLAGEVSS